MFHTLEEQFGVKSKQPQNHEVAWFAFWEKGISLEEFNKLPLPYIFSVLQTQAHYTEENEKELKKKKHR